MTQKTQPAPARTISDPSTLRCTEAVHGLIGLLARAHVRQIAANARPANADAAPGTEAAR